MASDRRACRFMRTQCSRRVETVLSETVSWGLFPVSSPRGVGWPWAEATFVCDISCIGRHIGDEPWNRSGSARQGLGDRGRKDQEGHRQPRLAGVHCTPCSGTVARPVRQTGLGQRLRPQTRAFPPMNLFVDTSVWSLALRRDSPPEGAEVLRLRGGARRGHDLHHWTGASKITAGLSRSARPEPHHRLLLGHSHDCPDARRSHLRGPTAQRMPPPRHTGRNHRCAARSALHQPPARHAVD